MTHRILGSTKLHAEELLSLRGITRRQYPALHPPQNLQYLSSLIMSDTIIRYGGQDVTPYLRWGARDESNTVGRL